MLVVLLLSVLVSHVTNISEKVSPLKGSIYVSYI